MYLISTSFKFTRDTYMDSLWYNVNLLWWVSDDWQICLAIPHVAILQFRFYDNTLLWIIWFFVADIQIKNYLSFSACCWKLGFSCLPGRLDKAFFPQHKCHCVTTILESSSSLLQRFLKGLRCSVLVCTIYQRHFPSAQMPLCHNNSKLFIIRDHSSKDSFVLFSMYIPFAFLKSVTF